MQSLHTDVFGNFQSTFLVIIGCKFIPTQRSEWERKRVQKMKILVIEDSKFQRVATERRLVQAGYVVFHAADGEDGLRSARENHPDLILLDMMLPKLSGLDVLRALMTCPPKTSPLEM